MNHNDQVNQVLFKWESLCHQIKEIAQSMDRATYLLIIDTSIHEKG